MKMSSAEFFVAHSSINLHKLFKFVGINLYNAYIMHEPIDYAKLMGKQIIIPSRS